MRVLRSSKIRRCCLLWMYNVSNEECGAKTRLTSSSSSSSVTGLLNIQLATVELGSPNPSCIAASKTDARIIFESRVGAPGLWVEGFFRK